MTNVYKDIQEEITGIGEWTFSGSLDDTIVELQNLRKQYSEYHKINIEIDCVYDGYYYGINVEAIGIRKETEEELQKRLETKRKKSAAAKKAAATREANKEQKERELLRKLKEKYECDKELE